MKDTIIIPQAELEGKHDKTWTAILKANFNYDNWHAGMAAEIVDGKATKKHGQIVMNDKDAQYFGRVNEIEKTAGLGCSIEYAEFTHSYEGVFGWEKDFKGFMDSPVSIVGGGEYELSKATTLGYTWTAAEHISYNQSVSHKLENNWTVSVNQAYDGKRLGTKQPAYDIGFGVTYKL